jgi:uroporphyrinogen decarboxylase
MNDLFLRACRREPVERPPVWMMRQAGRYLPEYRAVRARADFLTMVHTPELAARVTLQPVDILGVDAAIIFSDILVVPAAMGLGLTVEEGTGPRFHDPIGSPGDLERLRDVDVERDLGYVLEALRLTRAELRGRVPLIGFAGAPWTLMSYMVEGAGTRTFTRAKRFLVEQPSGAHALLGRLAATVGRFLEAQVAAGAQAVQLFDSWAAALGPRDFREFALPYLAEAVRAARNAGVPVIAFAPGAGWALEEIATATGADVIGVDWQTDAADARRRLATTRVALQGNLDPAWLYAPPSEIERRTQAMLEAFGGVGHIANLGHGILPDVPVEHAAAFVRAVQAWRPR